MATIAGNQDIINLCTNRFKNVLITNQVASDGSFPLEPKRTEPYGYSLFNMDTFCSIAEILSTSENELWNYKTPEGLSLKNGMEFIFPFIADKSKWHFAHDIYIWDEWPERQSCLLFAGLAYDNPEYISTYLNLPAYPTHPEVLRNLLVRHPAIWLTQ